MDKMKAVICTKYGTPEVLKIVEIEKPTPKDNEVLIKIIASSLNSGEVRIKKLDATGFLKFAMRFVLGFTKPRKPVLGTTFSGVVEQVGKTVKDFSVGDEIFGRTGFNGAHAEYIKLSDKSIIAKKPDNASFEEAAAVLFGAQTAMYFLDKAKISERTNPKVLIYGATGSVGTAAIQVAKYYNAHVTAVCSERGQKLAKTIGADDIIFYDKEDFTKSSEKFDIIFDTLGKISKKQSIHLLSDGGRYITTASLDVDKPSREQLELLRTLFESGKYNATIDRVYTINEIVEAHRYVDTGRKKGNVVIKIAE